MSGGAAPRIGIFHPGIQHSRQTALAFQDTNQLAWYATASDPPSRLVAIERVLPEKDRDPHDLLSSAAALPEPALVRRFATAAWWEIAADRLGARADGWARRHGVRRFAREIIKLIEREPVDVLWGYDTHALEVFRWAKQRGIRCVLDQTAVHPAFQDDVLSVERDRHPDFFPLDDSPFPRERILRQDEELALADLVMVGSDFCARSLSEKGCDPGKIRVVPYGYDDAAFPAARPERAPLADRPAQMLFVGAVSAAQGMAYLLEAFRALPPERATLTLVGPLTIPRTTFARYAAYVDHVPGLPTAGVIRHLLAADGFIFPSLLEAGGVALHGAIGAGLGIIQSSHADIPTVHGRNGIVLERVSAEALAQGIEDALNPPERLAQWGGESWQMRPERSWATYRRAIARTMAEA